jgi:fibronectin-binding autotransporter adhesin
MSHCFSKFLQPKFFGFSLGIYLFSISSCLHAATATWTDTTGAWTNSANWSPNTTFPNATTDDAVFGTLTADQAVDTRQSINVNTLTFNNDNFTLTLSNTVNSAPIIINGTNILLNGSGGGKTDTKLYFVNRTNTFTGNGSGTFNLSAGISNPGSAYVFQKQGTSTMAISANAGFSNVDVFILENGKLKISSASAFGAVSNIIINGGTIIGNIASRDITNMFTVNGDYTVDAAAGAGALSNSGPVILGSTTHKITVSTGASNYLVGVVSGSAGLLKAGSGSMLISGNNTFTGNVTNSAGAMIINSANALGTTSLISVRGGTLLYNVGYTNTGAAVFLSGGIIQEADQNVSLGALTLTANSSIQLNSGGTAGSLLFASGTNVGGGMLTIYGWNYNSVTDSGSDDLIFFTSTTAETSSFLNNITFFGLGAGARLLSTGELVPITPEPSTILYPILCLGFLGFQILLKKVLYVRS